jgi:transposase InsO family protein
MTSKSKKSKQKKQAGPYPFEFRLRIVRMHEEEKYPNSLIAEETGVGKSTISNWVKIYRELGEDGLRSPSRSAKKNPQIHQAVKEKIVDLKRSNPKSGSRRISDMLRRFFFLKASPTTVQKTLLANDLVKKQPVKAKKNPPKPRFFERSKPNQLWQSDICTFRLAGKNAYLIGFIDDYSRYITGLGFYRSQTASNVLETYRRAVGEYNVPKEMLTDNGRQYVNWRGTTNFQKELKKDRVKHIRSRPHHPMTLGKIERFWQTILQEFLFRSQFDSFDDTRERIDLWVKYYNHRRPHQGIKGLCPADRYFEIQTELKQTLERGIAENSLEMALRGKPTDPFYMVGRMNGQNVVIRAEKGKVRMIVDEPFDNTGKELVYDMKRENTHDKQQEDQDQTDIYGTGKTQGGSSRLDGKADEIGDLSGNGFNLEPAGPVAESGHGGDARSTGTQKEGPGSGFEQSPGETAGEKTVVAQNRFPEAGRSPGNSATEKEEGNKVIVREDNVCRQEETMGQKGS